MNKLIVYICMFCFSIGFSQFKPAEATLKTGEKIAALGKVSGDYFRYKQGSDEWSKKLHFSEIDAVKVRFSKDHIRTYKFFKIKESKKSIVLEERIVSEKVNLYARIVNNYVSGAGGVDIAMSYDVYYAKKDNETEVTFFGASNSIVQNFKGKVILFFSDCTSLVEKIERKEFKVRKDLGKIIQFYNNSCNKKNSNE